MHQRNRWTIDFEAERVEDYIFSMKQDHRGYRSEDKHTEQPDLALANVDCILRFPNNISSFMYYHQEQR